MFRSQIAIVAVLSLGPWAALAQVRPSAPARPAEAPRAAEPATPDALTEKGFIRNGNLYSLAEESELLDQMKTLRVTKRKADIESRQRLDAERKIAQNRKVIRESAQEYENLERRLPNVRDETARNRMQIRMNLMVRRINDAQAQEKELEQKADAIGSEAKTKFVDDLAEVVPRFEALDARYKAVAADAEIRAALEKINAAAPPSARATVGPSPEFTTALADLRKWQGDLESEAIPLREENGVHSVEVLIDGQRLQMTVNTGVTYVMIPWEIAERLKVTPGEKDPSIQLKLPNGALIDGKKITLKSVRVGRFTVNDVACVVLQQGLPDPPCVLGSSFLSHFVVKLNQSKGELHLTEVNPTGKKPAVRAAPPEDKPRNEGKPADEAPARNGNEQDTTPRRPRGLARPSQI